jgi:hypothetical protein
MREGTALSGCVIVGDVFALVGGILPDPLQSRHLPEIHAIVFQTKNWTYPSVPVGAASCRTDVPSPEGRAAVPSPEGRAAACRTYNRNPNLYLKIYIFVGVEAIEALHFLFGGRSIPAGWPARADGEVSGVAANGFWARS